MLGICWLNTVTNCSKPTWSDFRVIVGHLHAIVGHLHVIVGHLHAVRRHLKALCSPMRTSPGMAFTA